MLESILIDDLIDYMLKKKWLDLRDVKILATVNKEAWRSLRHYAKLTTPQFYTSNCLDVCIKLGHRDCVKLLTENNMIYNHGTLYKMILNGNTDCADLILSKIKTYDETELLMLMYDYDFHYYPKFTQSFINYVIVKRDLEFLIKHDIRTFNSNSVTEAVADIKILRYVTLHVNEIPWDEAYLISAILYRKEHSLQHLIELGCVMTTHSMFTAVKMNYVPCVSVLLEFGCPFTGRECKYAVNYGALDVLRYLIHEGFEYIADVGDALTIDLGLIKNLKWKK